MTLGERIARKRKEQRLSQEALGETLGVSRQSVYKWESGSALPEIDKLIAMSRLFGVTIGWLLGVEESGEGSAGSSLQPDGGKELTEAQLKMVEEIVDRYLAARQPAKKKRRWLWAAGLAAGLALCLVLHNEVKDVRWDMTLQYTDLKNRLESVTRTMDLQIESITGRVEEVLKSQNNLTASYGTEIVSADLAANTVSFTAWAVPKTYVEGMTAAFLVDDGSGPVEVPGQQGENQTFSASLTCALTDGIDISVAFITGDTRETQLLETCYGLYGESLPEVDFDSMDCHSAMMWKDLNEAGELNWTGEYVEVRKKSPETSASTAGDSRIGRAEARSLRVGLFQNRKLLGWLEKCEKPDHFKNFSEEEYDFYRFPDVSVKPEAGDVFTISAVVTDEYGREFVFAGLPYSVKADWGELITADGGAVGLTDPAGWEY